MVSLRCKLTVKAELDKIGLHCAIIDLGSVELLDKISDSQLAQFRKNLLVSGLILLDDKKRILVERIKNVITEMVHRPGKLPMSNYSDFISSQLQLDYTYLANIFSEVQGNTIQKFIISNKIEKVKELLHYDEMNITEIAYKLQYSSVGHLSSQFKKITGLTPSDYRQSAEYTRHNLENV